MITLSPLGEPGPVEVGETNPDVGVAANSLSGSDISGSSPISQVEFRKQTLTVDYNLLLTLENQDVLSKKILLLQVTQLYCL